MNIRLSSLVLACLAAGGAQAASFNCAHAFLPAEETICGNTNLSKLDEQTAGMYFLIVGSGAPQATPSARSRLRRASSSRSATPAAPTSTAWSTPIRRR